jgi:hypothetical protein
VSPGSSSDESEVAVRLLRLGRCGMSARRLAGLSNVFAKLHVDRARAIILAHDAGLGRHAVEKS